MKAFVGRQLRTPFLSVAACLPALISGCAGYQLGPHSLYRSEVRTVYVPIFESDSLRRNLGERLTEAVAKEIELSTPYKLASATQADSILSGRITNHEKHVVAETINNDPRDIEIGLVVQFQWYDRRGSLIRPAHELPLDSQLLYVIQSENLVAEAGQSVATAEQATMEQLARQIVAQMQAPW